MALKTVMILPNVQTLILAILVRFRVLRCQPPLSAALLSNGEWIVNACALHVGLQAMLGEWVAILAKKGNVDILILTVMKKINHLRYESTYSKNNIGDGTFMNER